MSLLVSCTFEAPDLCSYAFIWLVALLFLVFTRRRLEPDDGAFLNMRQARNGVFYSREQFLTYYGIQGETMWNEAPAAINEDGPSSEPPTVICAAAEPAGNDDGDAPEIESMPSTPEGAGSFGSDQEEPPEEPLNVGLNLRMGYFGEVLYMAQWHSTDTVSIGHFIGIVRRKQNVHETSIALAIGIDFFNQRPI